MLKLLKVAFVAGLCTMTSPSWAETYPSRTIHVVVPFPGGSATDIVARIIVKYLQPALNGVIVVENRPGANGVVGTTDVARAAGDGYTIMFGTNSTHAANLSLMKNVSYDPVADFAPIIKLGNFPYFFVMNPSIPGDSIQDFAKYAKANPGKVSYAFGNGFAQVAGATLMRRLGVDTVPVSYRGQPAAINDVMAGHVSAMFADLLSGREQVRAKTVKGLAMNLPKRSGFFPEIITMREAGIDNFDLEAWGAVFAPKGTPPEIVQKLATEIRKIVDRPDVREQLATAGFEVAPELPEELGKFVKAEISRWSVLVKDAGINPE